MNSLQDYKELFSQLNLTELSVEEGDFKLFLKKEAAPSSISQVIETPFPTVSSNGPTPPSSCDSGTTSPM